MSKFIGHSWREIYSINAYIRNGVMEGNLTLGSEHNTSVE